MDVLIRARPRRRRRFPTRLAFYRSRKTVMVRRADPVATRATDNRRFFTQLKPLCDGLGSGPFTVVPAYTRVSEANIIHVAGTCTRTSRGRTAPQQKWRKRFTFFSLSLSLSTGGRAYRARQAPGVFGS